MMVMKRIALALAGVALVAALTGCDSADHKSLSQVAQAATGFMASAKAKDMDVTLMIEPLKVGENRMVVTLSDESIAAVEAQVIMASMGHGLVVDLVQTGPGKWESTNQVIDMDGRWMVRLKSTLPDGEEKAATFHMIVK